MKLTILSLAVLSLVFGESFGRQNKKRAVFNPASEKIYTTITPAEDHQTSSTLTDGQRVRTQTEKDEGWTGSCPLGQQPQRNNTICCLPISCNKGDEVVTCESNGGEDRCRQCPTDRPHQPKYVSSLNMLEAVCFAAIKDHNKCSIYSDHILSPHKYAGGNCPMPCECNAEKCRWGISPCSCIAVNPCDPNYALNKNNGTCEQCQWYEYKINDGCGPCVANDTLLRRGKPDGPFDKSPVVNRKTIYVTTTNATSDVVSIPKYENSTSGNGSLYTILIVLATCCIIFLVVIVCIICLKQRCAGGGISAIQSYLCKIRSICRCCRPIYQPVQRAVTFDQQTTIEINTDLEAQVVVMPSTDEEGNEEHVGSGESVEMLNRHVGSVIQPAEGHAEVEVGVLESVEMGNRHIDDISQPAVYQAEVEVGVLESVEMRNRHIDDISQPAVYQAEVEVDTDPKTLDMMRRSNLELLTQSPASNPDNKAVKLSDTGGSEKSVINLECRNDEILDKTGSELLLSDVDGNSVTATDNMSGASDTLDKVHNCSQRDKCRTRNVISIHNNTFVNTKISFGTTHECDCSDKRKTNVEPLSFISGTVSLGTNMSDDSIGDLSVANRQACESVSKEVCISCKLPKEVKSNTVRNESDVCRPELPRVGEVVNCNSVRETCKCETLASKNGSACKEGSANTSTSNIARAIRTLPTSPTRPTSPDGKKVARVEPFRNNVSSLYIRHTSGQPTTGNYGSPSLTDSSDSSWLTSYPMLHNTLDNGNMEVGNTADFSSYNELGDNSCVEGVRAESNEVDGSIPDSLRSGYSCSDNNAWQQSRQNVSAVAPLQTRLDPEGSSLTSDRFVSRRDIQETDCKVVQNDQTDLKQTHTELTAAKTLDEDENAMKTEEVKGTVMNIAELEGVSDESFELSTIVGSNSNFALNYQDDNDAEDNDDNDAEDSDDDADGDKIKT